LGQEGKIHVSAADTYETIDLGSCTDFRGRVPVSTLDVTQGRTAVILALGQSNGANSRAVPYVPVLV
jgi:hypothetical protein